MMMNFRFGTEHDAETYNLAEAYAFADEYDRVVDLIQQIMWIYDQETEVMDKIDNLLERNKEMYAQRIELLFESLENYEDQRCLYEYLLYISDNPVLSKLLYPVISKGNALNSRLELGYLEASPTLLEEMDKHLRNAKQDIQVSKKRLGFEDDPTCVAQYRDKRVRMNQLLLVYQERLISLLSREHSSERNQQLELAFRQSILNCEHRLILLGVMIRFGYNSTMYVMENNYSIVQGDLDHMIKLLMEKEVDYKAVHDAQEHADFIQDRNEEIEARMALRRFMYE